MKLQENLQICLLAIASRYRESTLVINEEVLGSQSFRKQRCGPVELLERLQSDEPRLLQEQAQLVIDKQECVIYLVEQSRSTPAFWLHYQKRTQEEELVSLRRENEELKAENRKLQTRFAQSLPV